MPTNESILGSIKSMLGVLDESFDPELQIHINTVFPELFQLGLESAKEFEINDASSKWSDLQLGPSQSWVKSFVFYKVKLAFDPPQTANAVQAIKDELNHLSWRINISLESGV